MPGPVLEPSSLGKVATRRAAEHANRLHRGQARPVPYPLRRSAGRGKPGSMPAPLPGPIPPPREPVECPHCAEPTLPNLLADGTVVCSCAAERSLAPLAGRPGAPK